MKDKGRIVNWIAVAGLAALVGCQSTAPKAAVTAQVPEKQEIAWEKATAPQKCERLYAAALRGDEKAVTAHLGDGNEEVAIAATFALGRLGGAAALEKLLPLVTKPEAKAKLADARWVALGAAIARTAERGDKAAAVKAAQAVRALPAAPEMLRAVAARTLAAADPAFVASGLADKSRRVREAVLTAELAKASLPTIQNWLTVAEGEEWNRAFASLGREIGNLPAAERRAVLAETWRRSAPENRAAVSAGIFRELGLGALDLWADLAKDPACAAAAKRAYCALAARLDGVEPSAVSPDRKKWKANATRFVMDAAKAVDGDPATRWTSGVDPAGVEFDVDFGERLFVREITLETAQSPRDTPRGCRVYVSDDGQAWQGPVATCGEDTANATTFFLYRAARFVRFVAEKSRPGLHWSIHEIGLSSGISAGELKKIRETAAKFRAERAR